jgi:hypothetical protein
MLKQGLKSIMHTTSSLLRSALMKYVLLGLVPVIAVGTVVSARIPEGADTLFPHNRSSPLDERDSPSLIPHLFFTVLRPTPRVCARVELPFSPLSGIGSWTQRERIRCRLPGSVENPSYSQDRI